MTLKQRITDDMKAAMRAKDGARLAAIRLLLAAVKQREIDERVELDDAGVVAVVDKLLKQRRDSHAQYLAAGRQDLAEQEQFEVGVLSGYLPQSLTAAELDELVRQALTETAATGARDMGRVMTWLKPRLAGPADMTEVSGRVKAVLGGT